MQSRMISPDRLLERFRAKWIPVRIAIKLAQIA